MSRVYEAAQYNLPPCPKCGALQGDPCRTPSNKTCNPHKERLTKVETK